MERVESRVRELIANGIDEEIEKRQDIEAVRSILMRVPKTISISLMEISHRFRGQPRHLCYQPHFKGILGRFSTDGTDPGHVFGHLVYSGSP